jgi:hypothetical protein
MSVYMIQTGDDGPVKIGLTRDVRRRLETLQISSPTRLRLLALFEGSRELECELHRRFAAARIKGEWFKPIPELIEFAKGGAAQAKALLTKSVRRSRREESPPVAGRIEARRPAIEDMPPHYRRATEVMAELLTLRLSSVFMDYPTRTFVLEGISRLADEFALIREQSAEGADRGLAPRDAGGAFS